MKKSMIAAAVVATAFAATANAAYFQIAGASYNSGSGSTPLVPGSFNMVANSATDFTANTSGSANSTSAISNATDLGNLGGITAAADTVTYFSYESGGLGYFGVIINTSVQRTMTISMVFNAGDGASGGTKGVLTNEGIGSQTNSGGTFIDTNQVIGVGKSYYIFGGLSNGSAFNGSVSNGAGETGNFGIAYLNWNGSAWTTLTSLASGAKSSAISVASYSVPVPAPALLAGAGLVGAAALRRRMAKKA